ncbi:FAD-dependent oxidoreductase [Nonlabens arenilitoris]|uniref:FAD-dependent oxidoreductase n=1 Tax=Nonlabens arenilitoris TaxID=1217969 RepID=A0A2S7U7N3_9FLAO|nr:FAD-binding oxidoreductase [Nonlabens arenilitoris]PQJ30986.1 FAD-dependent oxidoreductase [Nonlabens arenilitoris]
MKDVIIVGSGIAACTLAWQLHQQGKTIVMITDRKKGSSSVAAGLYNPMVLKRFTAVWKAADQLNELNSLFDYILKCTAVDLRKPITVARRFHDDKESQTWVKKSKRDDLKDFMNPQIHQLDVQGIDALSGYGFVNGTGWVDTLEFMSVTLLYFTNMKSVILQEFDYSSLISDVNFVTYKEIKASHIIFAEGYRILDNPYFKYLPIQGNKGEVLLIKVPSLELKHIVKSSVFLMPYKDDLFWVGATYDRDDLEDVPSAAGKDFLTTRLERFLKLPYEVVEHKHGIRPTTIDRRPFVGQHSQHKNVWVFNGMGSRAVLIAPWASSQLIQRIFKGQSIHEEMDIKRFT